MSIKKLLFEKSVLVSINMSQFEAQSDVVETMSKSARPECDSVPGLQSRVEAPGAQRLNMSVTAHLVTTVVKVARVLVGLGQPLTIDREPGLVAWVYLYCMF